MLLGRNTVVEHLHIRSVFYREHSKSSQLKLLFIVQTNTPDCCLWDGTYELPTKCFQYFLIVSNLFWLPLLTSAKSKKHVLSLKCLWLNTSLKKSHIAKVSTTVVALVSKGQSTTDTDCLCQRWTLCLLVHVIWCSRRTFCVTQRAIKKKGKLWLLTYLNTPPILPASLCSAVIKFYLVVLAANTLIEVRN